ncbi:hypothetical protein JCM9803A_02580 [Rhodococcus erythropolis]
MSPLASFMYRIDGKFSRVDGSAARLATDFCDENFTTDIVYEVHERWAAVASVGVPPTLQYPDDLTQIPSFPCQFVARVSPLFG